MALEVCIFPNPSSGLCQCASPSLSFLICGMAVPSRVRVGDGVCEAPGHSEWAREAGVYRYVDEEEGRTACLWPPQNLPVRG